jgi:hypothetical protein
MNVTTRPQQPKREEITMFNRSLILAIIAASALTSTSALADNTYAGNNCLTHEEDMTRSGSKLQNISTTTAHTVACPVVRDTSALLGLDSATIWVVDQNFTSDVTCTVTSRNNSGSSVAFSSDSSSGTNAAVQSLTIGSLAVAVLGHYTMYCTVPAEFSGQRSSIVSYLIDED